MIDDVFSYLSWKENDHASVINDFVDSHRYDSIPRYEVDRFLRDNYIDYFWEAANDIFCNYFDDASVEMISDYCIGEVIHIKTADGNEITIESADQLYEYCGSREEQERREYEEETYYSSMI